MIKPFVLSCLSYSIPKIAGYFCTKSNAEENLTRIDKIRKIFSETQEKTSKIIGEKNWTILTEVTLDNAWVSAFFISYLINSTPLPLSNEEKIECSIGFFCISSISWAIRYGTTFYFPSLSKWVAPRSLC